VENRVDGVQRRAANFHVFHALAVETAALLALGGKARLQVGADALDDGFGGVFAHQLLQNRAISAEQDIRWQSIHSELTLDTAVGVQALEPSHIVAGDEGAPGGLVIVLADADENEISISIHGLKALEVRYSTATRTTPRGPEVQKDDFATKLREGSSRSWGTRSLGAGSGAFGWGGL
jgi:hypothetical protein